MDMRPQPWPLATPASAFGHDAEPDCLAGQDVMRAAPWPCVAPDIVPSQVGTQSGS